MVGPLRVGHLSTFYHTAVLMMAGGDTEATLGVPVQWRLFGTGPSIVEAFERGELDLAYIGLPPAIIAIDRGVRIKCVAGGHMEGTCITGRGARGHSDGATLGDTLAQFEAIGVPGRGSIHDVILADALMEHGLSGRVRVMRFRWADGITEALRRGEIHGAMGTPALAVAASRYAGCRLLWPPGGLRPHNPSYGIAATQGLIEGDQGLLERFLLLHERHCERLSLAPHEAAREIARYTGVVDEAFALEVIGISPRYCASLPPEYVQCTMGFVDSMRRSGYIKGSPGAEDIFDLRAISRTHPGAGHY